MIVMYAGVTCNPLMLSVIMMIVINVIVILPSVVAPL
jgi:hypothetical protein